MTNNVGLAAADSPKPDLNTPNTFLGLSAGSEMTLTRFKDVGGGDGERVLAVAAARWSVEGVKV